MTATPENGLAATLSIKELDWTCMSVWGWRTPTNALNERSDPDSIFEGCVCNNAS